MQNNKIKDINSLPLFGLQQLTNLNVAKNCIPMSELESTIKSVLLLKSLKELFLFDNEVAKDPQYRFWIADHTGLKKLDGLEIKGFVWERLSSLKQNWNMEKLVSGTKDEYFKWIEAEREIK